jgi:hypothetical protein
MKKIFYTIAFALITTFVISSCTEETIKPAAGTGSSDPCQFGGPNCPKKP